MNTKLVEHLIEDGWEKKYYGEGHHMEIVKDKASIFQDGSSWLILCHEQAPNGRIFDIHNPGDYEAGWTANLIKKLVEYFEMTLKTV